jgi:Prenyltransferase and squalene oxidase repeat
VHGNFFADFLPSLSRKQIILLCIEPNRMIFVLFCKQNGTYGPHWWVQAVDGLDTCMKINDCVFLTVRASFWLPVNCLVSSVNCLAIWTLFLAGLLSQLSIRTPPPMHPSIRPSVFLCVCQVLDRACRFLLSKQREDGGWAESYLSCQDKVGPRAGSNLLCCHFVSGPTIPERQFLTCSRAHSIRNAP